MMETPKRPWNVAFNSTLASTVNLGDRLNYQAAQSVAARDAAGYVQLSKTKTKSGRPIPQRQRLQKILKANVGTVIERFQKLQTMTATQGKVPLNYTAPTENTAGDAYFPVYMFDLLALANRGYFISNSASQNVQYPAVMYRLARKSAATTTDLTNRYYFVPDANCKGVAPDGTTDTYTWACEKAPRGALVPTANTHYDWFDFRFLFFGAKKRPMNIYINIVQFTDRHKVPYWWSENNTGLITGTPTIKEDEEGVTENSAREWNEFWAGFTD